MDILGSILTAGLPALGILVLGAAYMYAVALRKI